MCPISLRASALVLGALLSACSAAGAAAARDAPREGASRAATWVLWEQALTSTRAYPNPYADVILSVIYTGPEGETLHGYGFWDGGDTFRIRAAFPRAGIWRWKTACSDPSNASLHEQRGVVDVIDYRGPGELYRRGFPRVSTDGRYLTYGDGTPFFWLGDTAWAASLRASQEDWQRYVDDRAAGGVSVVHLSPASSWAGTADTEGNVPFSGDGIGQWNPPYWQGLDQKVQYANRRGIVVLLVGIMEPVERYPDAAAGRIFARNIVARLSGSAVIFSPSFDSGYEVVCLMEEVGAALRQATPVHLITNHFGTIDVQENLHDAKWLSFDMFQSGHNGWRGDEQLECITARAREMPLYLRQLVPARPCVNGEAVYDGDPAGKQHATAFRARQTAYLSLLSGACGYSFGISGIWDWGAGVPRPRGDMTMGDRRWSDSLGLPISDQMAHLGRLFRSVEWWRLFPAHGLIRNQAANAWETMVLAKSDRGDFALAYLPDNAAIEIDMSAFPTPMRARWFCPVTGTYLPGPVLVPQSGTHRFPRPGTGDWVLLLGTS